MTVRDLHRNVPDPGSDLPRATRLTRVSAVDAPKPQAPPPLVETGADPGGTSARATVAVSTPAPAVATWIAPAIGPAPAIAAVPAPAPSAPAAAPAPEPAPTAVPGRPAPSRTAVLAAFQSATRPAAGAAALPAPAVAPPAPVPLMVAPMSAPVTLSRVETAVSSAPNSNRSSAQSSPAAPDLEALADYVLERLRGELRDGRERLGFLLDDSH